MQQPIGHLFIVSAPSGAGKSSLIQALLAQHNDMQVSVSHTTRAPRPGEQHGVHYYFVSEAQFQQQIDAGDFLEWAEVFGNFYGTSRHKIQQARQQGMDVFLDIDWQGARQIRQQEPSAIGIFILPPSLTALEQRLRSRGQDSDEIIARRMEKAFDEMSHANEYQYLMINDDFQQSLADFNSIVLSQRQRFVQQQLRQTKILHQLLAKSSN